MYCLTGTRLTAGSLLWLDIREDPTGECTGTGVLQEAAERLAQAGGINGKVEDTSMKAGPGLAAVPDKLAKKFRSM